MQPTKLMVPLPVAYAEWQTPAMVPPHSRVHRWTSAKLEAPLHCIAHTRPAISVGPSCNESNVNSGWEKCPKAFWKSLPVVSVFAVRERAVDCCRPRHEFSRSYSSLTAAYPPEAAQSKCNHGPRRRFGHKSERLQPNKRSGRRRQPAIDSAGGLEDARCSVAMT